MDAVFQLFGFRMFLFSSFEIASSEIAVFSGFSVSFCPTGAPQKVDEEGRDKGEVYPGFLVKIDHYPII